MPQYQYKVVPAPSKGKKGKGVKSAEGRFANAVEHLMNEMASEGWEYLRADMLPNDERQGLTGSTTNWRNILVFRREKPGSLDAFQPRDVAPAPAALPALDPPDAPLMIPTNGAERMLIDNGVEEISDVSGMTAALKARAASTKASDDDS